MPEFCTAINKTFEKNLAKDAEVSATEVRGKDTTYSPQNVLDGKDDTYWTVNDETKSPQEKSKQKISASMLTIL